MLRHRESSKPAETKKPVEYAARGLWQLWSWDITYMKTDIKGQFFYLYMIIDVWSRKIIAARVHELSCGAFAERTNGQLPKFCRK
ncbi:hypothetical protein [Desulfobotulus mexicanus]|uniref:hypothetical protein n=1 Tax=Desulfobotulus mexicanus TaxID=2586642 RepID=UPI0015D34A8C